MAALFIDRNDPRFKAAINWVRVGARRTPGMPFTASIGPYRLTCWKEGKKLRFRTWYSTEEVTS